MDYTVTTKICGELIEQEETRLTGEVVHSVMNTKEEHIRDALIKLGWTPPKDD